MATTQTTRTVNLVINGKGSEASIDEVKRAVAALGKTFNKLREADNPELYKQTQRELLKLSNTYKEMRNSVNSFGQANSTFLNDFKTLAAGVVGGNLITGAIQGARDVISQSIDSITKKSDEMSDVQKTTGLTLEGVKALDKQLGEIDTRTSRSDLLAIAEVGGRFGIAEEELLGFVRAADRAGVALGDTFTGGAEEVATQLSRLQSLFDETKELGVEEAFNAIGSAMNELGSNFKANEQYMANFATRVGNLPGKLKPTIADAFALATSFQESGIEAEVASRAYSIFLNQAIEKLPEFASFMGMSLTEAENLINTDPTKFFVKFSEATKGMKATDLGGLLQKLGVNADGANKIIGSMSNNTERFAEIQKVSNTALEKAISLINEFNIKNNNAAGQFAIALKDLNAAFKPYLNTIGEAAISFIKFVGENVRGIVNIAKVLTVGATAWLTYRTAVLLSDRANITFFVNLMRTERGLKLQKIATLAAATAKALFTGNLSRATRGMRAFNAVTKISPLGLFITIVTAATTAYALFSDSTETATKKQEEFNEAALAGQAILKNSSALQEQVNVRKSLSKAQLEDVKQNIEAELTALDTKATKVIALQNKEAANAKKNLDATLKAASNGKGVGPAVNPNSAAALSMRLSKEQMLTDGLETEAKKREGINAAEIASTRKKLQENLAAIDAELKARPADKKYAPGVSDETSKAAKEAKDKRDKELEEIRKGFDAINSEREKFEHHTDVSRLEATEKEIADLDASYEEQLNKLLEYTQRSISITGLSNEERAALISTANLLEQQLEAAHLAELERIKGERNATNAVKTAEDKETLRVALLSDHAKEIDSVNAHYDKLQELAKGNAEALALIEAKRGADINKINKDNDDKKLAAKKAVIDAENQVAIDGAEVLTQLANLTAKQGEQMNEFQRAAAIVSILVNQGVAISNALRVTTSASGDNVATGGLAGVAKFVAISGMILSTVGQLKGALEGYDNPKAPQFYGGGMTDVYGATDGRRYSAKPIGSIANGGRVSGTSLGLLAERGAEFVIPNSVYTHPANAGIMGALESTVTNTQRGGGAAIAGSDGNTQTLAVLTKAVYKLVAKLDEPIRATTYLDLQELEDKQAIRASSKSVARY